MQPSKTLSLDILGFASPQSLSLMQELNQQCRGSKQHRYSRGGDETLRVLRRVDLLPHDQGQPGAEDVAHLVHGRHYDGTLFVIV